MTVSPVLADAWGTPAIGEPASAAAIATPAAAIRRFFGLAHVRQPAGAANDLAFGIRKSPPLELLLPTTSEAEGLLRWLRPAPARPTWASTDRRTRPARDDMARFGS